MFNSIKMLASAGFCVVLLARAAYAESWSAQCKAKYDARVAKLEPKMATIPEPVRIDDRKRLEGRIAELELIKAACFKQEESVQAACKAESPYTTFRADCVNEGRIIKDACLANTEPRLVAARERRISADSLDVSVEPFDRRRIEGMAGPLTPRARIAREAARKKRTRINAAWAEAQHDRERCVFYAPVPARDGKCDAWMSPGWSSERTNADGTQKAPDLCFPDRPVDHEKPQSVMSTSLAQSYEDNQPIRVAFDGGSPAMRKAIRDIANEWAEAANGPVGYTKRGQPIWGSNVSEPLVFDFGQSTDQGFKYNSWSPNDEVFAAEIRIAFDDDSGFWSLVGRESVIEGIAHPGEPSMNLAGFHGYYQLPSDWRAIVFHEFGHALGLQHEHQHPISECGAALRMEDDEGYALTLNDYREAVNDAQGRRPGIYSIFANAPNFWEREVTQFNVGQLKESGDLDTTPFDPASIMRYEFAAQWYRDDAPTECLPSGKRATKPSNTDFAMVARTYQKLMTRQVPQ